ncbi:MAG: hypothetical protein Q8R00_02340 [Candidatus Nanoarchaeia archaeon]|nr:hypothetical protein [Candidatus Nanoarchaeia archaeon]
MVDYKDSSNLKERLSLINRLLSIGKPIKFYNITREILDSIESPLISIKEIYNKNKFKEMEKLYNNPYSMWKILPNPQPSAYAPCEEVSIGEPEPCMLGVEIPQVSTSYNPIKVVKKKPLGRLRFGETERSNIILDAIYQLFNYSSQHGRDLTWHLDDAKIDVKGPKVDRVFFETTDGVISGSIVYLRNSLLTRDRIRTVVHFNSEDEKDMNEYFGLHKILMELNSKKYPKHEVLMPFTPKKFKGQGQAPAAR